MIAPLDKTSRLIRILKLAVAAGSFAYVVFRALTLDIVNDEWPGRVGYVDMLTSKKLVEQMNFLAYVVNTACLDLLPFRTMVSIRIPSVASFLLYLYAAARLTRHLRRPGVEALTFIALITNAFLLDFFSLGRGYGPSLAFSLLSLMFLADICNRAPGSLSAPKAYGAIWSVTVALLMNLGWLYFYLAVCGILGFWSIDIQRLQTVRNLKGATQFATRCLRTNLYLVANLAIIAVFWTHRVVLLMQAKLFFSGGTTGFAADTVRSLIQRSLYDIFISHAALLWVAYGLIVVSLGLAIGSWIRRDKTASRRISSVMSTLIMLYATLVLLSHHIAGTRLVHNRSALILIPLFTLQLGFFADNSRSKWQSAPVLVLTICCILLGVYNLNLTHTKTWRENATTRELLDDLDRWRRAQGRDLVILGISYTKPHRKL